MSRQIPGCPFGTPVEQLREYAGPFVDIVEGDFIMFRKGCNMYPHNKGKKFRIVDILDETRYTIDSSIKSDDGSIFEKGQSIEHTHACLVKTNPTTFRELIE